MKKENSRRLEALNEGAGAIADIWIVVQIVPWILVFLVVFFLWGYQFIRDNIVLSACGLVFVSVVIGACIARHRSAVRMRKQLNSTESDADK